MQELLRVLHPEGSTLLVARDTAINIGLAPPVVTDDWWLDVVEASAVNDLEGTFQESMGWGRWGFPLPPRSPSPRERGYRLAWAAAQRGWQTAAQEQRISQVTHPSTVLQFIETQPGLEDMCWEHPSYLLSYAPLLALPGFSGKFEQLFDKMLGNFLTRHDRTTSGCPDYIALRDIERCGKSPESIAWYFVHGELHGPSVTCLDDIDVLAWLLSKQSSWVPRRHHSVLVEGTVRDNPLFLWSRTRRTWSSAYDHALDAGAFEEWFTIKWPGQDTQPPPAALRDLEHRLGAAAEILALPETGSELLTRVLDQRIIERHVRAQRESARSRPGRRSSISETDSSDPG